MPQEYMDIEKLLQEGNNICIKPQGYSMYPTLVPGRDEAIIEPLNGKKLRRGDVVLYRRKKEEGGILVLHRIQRITAEGIYLVGDNQKEIEGPVPAGQVRGIMAGMNRKGKYVAATRPAYRMAAGLWLLLRPARTGISRMAAGINRCYLNFLKK